MESAADLAGLTQTELLRRAYLASDALGSSPDDRSLALYDALMGEIERRASSIETPIGTLRAEAGEYSDGYWGIQVNLIKPDGTGGLVSWTEVSDELGEASLHTFAYDGANEEPDRVECRPDGFWMNEKMDAHAGDLTEAAAHVSPEIASIDHGEFEDCRLHELAARLAFFAKDLDPYGFDDAAVFDSPADEADLVYDGLHDSEFASALYSGLSKLTDDDIPSELMNDFDSIRSDLAQYVKTLEAQKAEFPEVPRNPQAYAAVASKIAGSPGAGCDQVEQKRTHGI